MKSSNIRPAVIKKEFIRKFAKNKKLTVFQKRQLFTIISSIWFDYEMGLSFAQYIKGNQINIEAFINDLDSESKDEVKTILDYVNFMDTHTLMETVNFFMSKGDEIFEYMNMQESIKKKYKIDLYEESIFKYKHGLKYTPQNIIESMKNKDFLDCGGYIGGSALIFEKEYNPSIVYSFEPDPVNLNILLKNIKLHNLKKVIPISKGVGEKSGTAKFCSKGALSYVSDEDANTKIEIIAIDEFVSKKNLTVGVIKVDVEGTELDVLKGAKNTIKQGKPVLLIGIYHNPEEFFETKKYIKDLRPDYTIKIKSLSDFRPLAEIHLIAW